MSGPQGVSELGALLRTMQPQRLPGSKVFVTGIDVPHEHALATVREAEGLSCIVDRDVADAHGWAYGPVLAWISLSVHSDLEAVGLTAAVASTLVPEEDAEPALSALGRLSRHGS